MDELVKRRESTARRLDELRGRLDDAAKLIEGKACVYVSGSFARGEAGDYSDVDAFIVGDVSKESDGEDSGGKVLPLLDPLDDVLVRAELIRGVAAQGLPPFDAGGRWLEHMTIATLVDTLGEPEDDAINTFTARLLLLLESKALLGADFYENCIDQVLSKYWRNFEGHEDTFMPAFLANDILRLWRTFCVNYEARTKDAPEAEKAKRRLKNYKLKHSRLLTCYSALALMLAEYKDKGTVRPDAAREMVGMTPTERMDNLAKRPSGRSSADEISRLLGLYERFLDTTNESKHSLVERFMESDYQRERRKEALEFGDAVFEVLAKVGEGSDFYRLLVV